MAQVFRLPTARLSVKQEGMTPKRKAGGVVLHPAQSRMARAALCWTVRDAGEKAGCGASTVSRMESGAADARAGTARALLAAYEAAGLIIDWDDDGPGVRLRAAQPPA